MADLSDADDVMQDVFVTKNHDELLFFTNLGRVYSMKVFQVPEGSRVARGRAIVNLLPLTQGEHVVKLLSARDMESQYLVMCTKFGTIKKTDAMSFAKIRSTGIRAVTLNDNDELVFCGLSSGTDSIIVATHKGQGIHFNEAEIRSMGRQAAGVRGIRLKDKDYVVGVVIVGSPEVKVLFATSRGYGKQVRVGDFRVAHRGGLGVRTIPTTTRNGDVIGLVIIADDAQILLIDTNGKIMRLLPEEIRTMGRQAKGVRLIRLDSTQRLNSIVSFSDSDNEEEGDTEEGVVQTVSVNMHSDNQAIDVASEGEIDSEFEDSDEVQEDEE